MSKDTVITFRSNKSLVADAREIYSELGLNLSTAINLFLKQTVIKRALPIELELNFDAKSTYPDDFFALFGEGKDLDIEEPSELDISLDGDISL